MADTTDTERLASLRAYFKMAGEISPVPKHIQHDANFLLRLLDERDAEIARLKIAGERFLNWTFAQAEAEHLNWNSITTPDEVVGFASQLVRVDPVTKGGKG